MCVVVGGAGDFHDSDHQNRALLVVGLLPDVVPGGYCVVQGRVGAQRVGTRGHLRARGAVGCLAGGFPFVRLLPHVVVPGLEGPFCIGAVEPACGLARMGRDWRPRLFGGMATSPELVRERAYPPRCYSWRFGDQPGAVELRAVGAAEDRGAHAGYPDRMVRAGACV